MSCGTTFQLRRSQYYRCPGARYAFVSRFQNPPQTTGNEASISAGTVQPDGLNIVWTVRPLLFYAYALPFNVITNVVRILTVIFHTEEGFYTRNVCVNTQFWHLSIIISWIINFIIYFQVSRITNDFSVFLYRGLIIREGKIIQYNLIQPLKEIHT